MPYFKMPDGTYEEGANQAAASRTYNARRAELTVRQKVPVTIEQLSVQQQITPRVNEPINLQILEQGKPIRPTVVEPVRLQRANVVQVKQPVIAPLVIEPADNRVRPIRPPVRGTTRATNQTSRAASTHGDRWASGCSTAGGTSTG
jgi:hypothetical protein